MATLPSAGLTINEAAGAFASGTDFVVVLSCVSKNPDSVPRVWGSTQDMLNQYNYAPGIAYSALHFQKTRKPVIFIGLPITTAGYVGSQDNSGMVGTSLVSVAAASSGIMEKCSGVVTVASIASGASSGVVGADQFGLQLSMDGGQTQQAFRLSGSSYTVPQLGIVLNFGAGTLNVNDVFKFETAAPMWGSTAITLARQNLAAQQQLQRSWLVEGRLPNSTFAGYVTTETNNYETSNERYVYARCQVPDYAPLAKMASVKVTSQSPGSCTFAATTITRTTGSWITDGFAVGDLVTVAGSTANNGTATGPITTLTATVLTVSGETWTVETDATSLVVTGAESLVFAGGTTITRSGDTSAGVTGSFLLDGFAVGQTIVIAGSTSNNVTAVITNVTATVITCSATTFTAETNSTAKVSIKQSQTLGAFTAAQVAAFATVDAQKRIDLGYGRAFVSCPITGWQFRRPAAWAASLREFGHDLQIPTWRKDDGPLDGWQITDANGNKADYDERVDGGALAGRFTCFRTYGNGPLGAFIALSLTRDVEGALLSRTHNLAVVDLAAAVIQEATERFIGAVLQLNENGTGTEASLSLLEQKVNKQLAINLLQNDAEGPRASNAFWTASRTDLLNVAGAKLNGTGNIELNGTLEQIATSVVVT